MCVCVCVVCGLGCAVVYVDDCLRMLFVLCVVSGLVVVIVVLVCSVCVCVSLYDC